MAWHSVIVHNHIRRVPFIQSAQSHRFGMYRILMEVFVEEFLTKGVESCHMELPVRMLFLKLIMNCRSVYIFHRDKDQIQLLRKIPVCLIGQQLL